MDENMETFETEGEAIAFCEGLETATTMIDDDHLAWDAPIVEGGRWVVRVRFNF
jgi:hypothetical protein